MPFSTFVSHSDGPQLNFASERHDCGCMLAPCSVTNPEYTKFQSASGHQIPPRVVQGRLSPAEELKCCARPNLYTPELSLPQIPHAPISQLQTAILWIFRLQT